MIDFNDTPAEIRDASGDWVAIGRFDGEFEFDRHGTIDVIRIKNWDVYSGTLTLLPFSKDPSDFRSRLFDALSLRLARDYAEQIESEAWQMRNNPARSLVEYSEAE